VSAVITVDTATIPRALSGSCGNTGQSCFDFALILCEAVGVF
jgi:hypothetical protein